MTLSERMVIASAQAGLNVSDMAFWFEVTRASMNTWINEGREPLSSKRMQLDRLLNLLETVINSGSEVFPIPLNVRQYERRAYIQKVKNAVRKIPSTGIASRGQKVLGGNKK